MGRLSLIAIATGFALLGTTVHAQQQPSSPPPPPPAYGAPISLEQAKAEIAGAAAESKKNGWNHVFAVVDGGGTLIALEKSDLAGNASVSIAQAKARMAASFRAPTKAYQDRLAAGETFILALPGAIPGGRRRADRRRWQTHRRDRRERRNVVAGSSIGRGGRRGREVTRQYPQR